MEDASPKIRCGAYLTAYRDLGLNHATAPRQESQTSGSYAPSYENVQFMGMRYM
jgi:hypothetical protein